MSRVVPFVVVLGLTLGVAGCQPPLKAEVLLDQPYVAGGGAKQQLDLYLPAREHYPTVVFVHGGAWVMGDRKDAANGALARALQAQGVACALVSYRLVPEAMPADQVRDVAAAFAWVRSEVAKRGGDGHRVFLAGHSAGGHLAAMVAGDPAFLKDQGLSPADVAGCVTIGAPLVLSLDKSQLSEALKDAPDWAQSLANSLGPIASALNGLDPSVYVGKGKPKMLVMVADGDYAAIRAQAAAFEKAAKGKGGLVETCVLVGRDHLSALSKMPLAGDQGLKRLLAFIGETPPAR
ncbi:MAG: alpha/beta hydrolase [Fimbriimonadaceae bacterium]|nr:alpha/beta hydrolase [Chthonomonadaceae bacterium]MCO5296036.1 alpha/beta hydrolase [Fimbriimonadaceae bacterium]